MPSPKPKEHVSDLEWPDTLDPLMDTASSDSEGEDDLEQDDLLRLNEAVIASTDWTAETIVRQLDRGNIDINPVFQRRDAWTRTRKSKFIESLIIGLPIPQLVLAENKNQKGSYIIIDGKQRLLSLRQFSAKPDDKQYDALKLQGLEILTDLEGLTLQDLENDPSKGDWLRAFQNQTIRTVVIKGWPNESVLYLIFLRLNTGSVQLSPQELRQALHPGPFLAFVEEQSREMDGLRNVLKLKGPDFRMRDAELLLRYFAFHNFLPQYKGNLKKFLDDACEEFNKKWSSQEAKLRDQLMEMEQAFVTTFEIFGEQNAFRKWDGKAYERRFNRAVFDIMMFYFSNPSVRKLATARVRRGIEADFKQLCESNQGFRTSLETTTKSVHATITRLGVWGATLAKRLKGRFSIPRLHDNQIEI